jgi:hypothetical protein
MAGTSGRVASENMHAGFQFESQRWQLSQLTVNHPDLDWGKAMNDVAPAGNHLCHFQVFSQTVDREHKNKQGRQVVVFHLLILTQVYK